MIVCQASLQLLDYSLLLLLPSSDESSNISFVNGEQKRPVVRREKEASHGLWLIASVVALSEITKASSSSVWPDCWIICLIFGHLQHWKCAQKYIKFANASQKVCQILKELFQNGKSFLSLCILAKFRQIWSHWSCCNGAALFVR